MDSDSDATIILDSEDEEAMDVEDIPYVQEEIVISNAEASGAAPIDLSIPHNVNVQVNIANSNVIENAPNAANNVPAIENPSYEQQPVQQNLLQEINENVQPEVVEPREILETAEDQRSESPSLLSGTISRDQNELPTETPAEDKNDRSPQKRPRSDYENENEDDGKICPICLDNWTNMGDHRICALKCGHLFGSSCIIRWFSTQKKKSCPTCKKKAVKSDIRYIYAKRLIAMDASELEDIKKQLNNVTEEKNRIQIELTRAVCREHLIMQQVDELKKKVKYLDSALEVKQRFNQTQTNNEPTTSDSVRMYMDKSLEICKEGGCRVLDYYHDVIVATMTSPNNLFRGFGVRKIDISTYRPTAFIPLHTMSIRDVRFHPQNPWLLSVSFDKTAKVVDTQTNLPISVYNNGDDALWSCCWDVNNPNMFYVGKRQGSVAKFDLRQVGEPVCTLEVPGDMSPVVSVSSMAASPGSAVASGGVVACKLNSLWIFENTGNEYTRYPLPMEGPFMSMMYQNDNKQLLVSTRSNSRFPYSRHQLCNIESGTSNNLLCNTIHCFPGSTTQKFLSRSCIVSNKSKYYVAAHQEATKVVSLWSINTGRKACTLPAHDPVLDLCSVNTDSANFLVSLSERKLEFFKFT